MQVPLVAEMPEACDNTIAPCDWHAHKSLMNCVAAQSQRSACQMTRHCACVYCAPVRTATVPCAAVFYAHCAVHRWCGVPRRRRTSKMRKAVAVGAACLFCRTDALKPPFVTSRRTATRALRSTAAAPSLTPASPQQQQRQQQHIAINESYDKLTFLHRDPDVLLVDDFLTAEQCASIIDRAKDKGLRCAQMPSSSHDCIMRCATRACKAEVRAT